jgi:endonuclease/exonuclease/phosphatase (EEP) superfamily protein YafD
MKRNSFFALSAFFLLSTLSTTVVIADEDCNFACKSIPAMKDVMRAFGTATEASLPTENLNILVWNLYKGRKEGLQEDLLNLSKDADLVFTQEFLDNATFRKQDQFKWTMATQFIWDEGSTPTGCSLGAKVEPSYQGFTRTVDKEPFVKTPKVQVVAKYPLVGRDDSLLAISIHGILMRKTAALERQLNQVAEIVDAHKGPVIYAGDFNTRNKDRKKMVNAWMAKRGFKSAISLDLDHIYVRGLKVISAKELNKIESSDHPPLIATLVVE